MTPLLRLDGISKCFSDVPVLREVSLTAAKGEVLGIAGENGAGKSTLMNILGGVIAPDAGNMVLDDRVYLPGDPSEASARGVAFVHQELNLFPNLSIAENLFLTDFPRRRVLGLPIIDRRSAAQAARRLLDAVELPLSPDTPVERLSQGERQLVEVAKALDRDARIVIFDEPTTSLAARESARLFAIIERLQARGAAVIYISHALADVRRLSSRILILRDGEAAATGPAGEFTEERMISCMVGRAIGQLYPTRRPLPPDPEPLLEARGLTHPDILEDVGFTLHSGEVLGVAGLMGSGRSELARILFGLDPCERGEILLSGDPIQHLSPRERIRRGLAFLTENRRDDGLLMPASVLANLALVEPQSSGLEPVAGRIGVRCASLDRQPVRQLSGGNQQKVALGKWLVSPPRVFLLDEPTRGIDVGARAEIYRIVAALAATGVGILMISSEIEELTGMCDRILVMRRGEIRASIARPDFDREQILRVAL
jgi:ribose transport system ATP-binding protein